MKARRPPDVDGGKAVAQVNFGPGEGFLAVPELLLLKAAGEIRVAHALRKRHQPRRGSFGCPPSRQPVGRQALVEGMDGGGMLPGLQTSAGLFQPLDQPDGTVARRARQGKSGSRFGYRQRCWLPTARRVTMPEVRQISKQVGDGALVEFCQLAEVVEIGGITGTTRPP